MSTQGWSANTSASTLIHHVVASTLACGFAVLSPAVGAVSLIPVETETTNERCNINCLISGETVIYNGDAVVKNIVVEMSVPQKISGVLELQDNATSYGTVLNDKGFENVRDNAVARGTIINSNGTQNVYSEAVDTVVQGSGGRQYGYENALITGTQLNNGGQQWLKDNAHAKNTTIEEGSSQYLSDSARVTDTTINHGAQYISGLNAVAEGTTLNGTARQQLTGGLAVNTTLNGNSVQTLQFQTWAPGFVENTILNDNSVQYVYFSASTAKKTQLNDTSRQYIYFGSQAEDTHINGGHQIVYSEGYADRTRIDAGIQSVANNAIINDTTINGGRSYLYDGARATGFMNVGQAGGVYMDAGAVADNITLAGTLYITDIDNDTADLDPAYVGNLTLQGGNVSFLLDSYGEYAALTIDNLSGSGHFLFNSSLAKKNANFVEIGQGAGSFTIMVFDSGHEIADDRDLTVNLIHDQRGEAEFSLVSANYHRSAAIDGGTYLYTLYHQQNKDGYSGNVWYLGAMTDGNEGNEGDEDNEDNEGNEGNEGDGGSEGDNGNNNGNGGGSLITTPSTDAVLSLATVGLNVMRSEMDGLRSYRNHSGRERKAGEGNVWGHYLGKKSHVSVSSGAEYTLHQNGLELGGDRMAEYQDGTLVSGAFITLTKNHVLHARGGKSHVDSYGIGGYATWYHHNGVYIDGVVKANRLNNNLRVRMTNGGNATGEWHQYGLSAATESGILFQPDDTITVEPFFRLTGTQINDADIRLSNGMRAKTGAARSLIAGMGIRTGGHFSSHDTVIAPYIQVEVEQELAKSNRTVINNVNHFDNNLNGTSGKYGLGLSADVTRTATLYGEMNYRQGRHIEEPIQGVVGIRMRF